MSDQQQKFDRLFRDKMGSHELTPPGAVWDNIVEQRSFGHIVTKNILSHWRGLSILLLFLLFNSSINTTSTMKNESIIAENEKITSPQQSIQSINPTSIKQTDKQLINEKWNAKKVNQKASTANINRNDAENARVPDLELLASLEQAAFTRPKVSDPMLNSYIKHLEGWETAKPISFVRYEHMDKISLRAVSRPHPNAQPIGATRIDYDYVVSKGLIKKPFKERISVVLAFIPQHIEKSMKADFNLSSAYLRDRLKTENFRMAYTASALLHYELKNNAFLQSGLNFTQIYEELHYENEKRFSNQYNFLEVPFYYGYEARNAKWGWMFKGGLGVQVYNGYQGFILKKNADATLPPGTSPINPQYRMRSSDAIKNMVVGNHTLSPSQDRRGVLDLENEAENPYKKAGVVNLHVSGGLTYYHSIKTSFILSPHYSRSMNSITNRDAKFTENIHYFGISLGSRIKF